MAGYHQIYEKIHQMIKNDHPEGLAHLSFDEINYLWCVYYEKLFNILIGSNGHALRAAKREAERRGYNSVILSTALTGEARKAASLFVSATHEALQSLSHSLPLCF